MTPESLAAAFGEANVASENIYLGEGFFEKGTVLFPKSPEDRLHILWKDEKLQQSVRTLSLRGNKSSWRTAGGLTLGVNLQSMSG